MVRRRVRCHPRLAEVSARRNNCVSYGSLPARNPPLAGRSAAGLSVTSFGRRLHTSVTAVPSILATGRAGALSIGGSVVARPKIALFRPVLDPIAAVVRVLAVPGAAPIRTVVYAVITLLALVDDTVSAMDAAMNVTVALVVAVLCTFVTLFTRIFRPVAAGA